MTQSLRLDEADEYCHPIEEATNFNESMYANVLDGPGGLGLWLRVGNRPNEGHAEVSCCVYLPDGRVGFMFGRPECTTNDVLAAGGAEFAVVTPFQQVRMSYAGHLCLLTDPAEMADPKRAFTSNPIVPASISIDLIGLAAPFGGEAEEDQGLLSGFARGHYEQHVRGSGVVEVDGTVLDFNGHGLRDHSWGPRYWQNLSWYRFLPLTFGPDFAMSIVLIGDDQGGLHPGGAVLRPGADGVPAYVPIEEVEISSDYDAEHYPRAQRLTVRTAERSYQVVGESLSLLPLRNRRDSTTTRITEAFTRFTCEDREGFGMSEYLDQVVGGVPTGRAW